MQSTPFFYHKDASFRTTDVTINLYELTFLSTAVVCPRLSPPSDVSVVPASCSQADVEYGTRCVFYCGDGYELSGPRYTTCQNDTSWTDIAPLSCVRGKNRVTTATIL